MFPTGTSDSEQGPKARRFPYLIVPLDPPTTPISGGAMYMEALVFALEPYPPEKILADYCEAKGLDAERFNCHPVTFAKDLREGKGTLSIRRDGDVFRGRINWRR